MKFSIGDTIIYGTQGVCKILRSEKKDFCGELKEYLVLEPVYAKNSFVFIPTDNENLMSKMRQISSYEEICELIKNMPEYETIWEDDENKRKEMYREWMASGDRVTLIKGIKSVYLHWKEVTKSGKKLHIADERFLKDAEKLLYNEFALVLNINPDQVLPFIMKEIEIKEK